MKHLLSLILFFTLLTAASAEDYDLGPHGQLTIAVAKAWEITPRSIRDVGYDLTLRPKDSTAAFCKITALYPPSIKKRDRATVEADFKRGSEKFVPDSVEKKVTLQEFKLKSGYGFYATFTDESLVGKPPMKDNWKVSCPGVIDLAPDVIVAVTIYSDDVNGDLHKQAMEMLQSLTLTKK